mmetsp:Transcript_16735/g.24573  ORF Transcript_16735/g.24573 Transcript_16735/m.24573 type:complete len:357 (+) Transcript_16735:1182-2252(+)
MHHGLAVMQRHMRVRPTLVDEPLDDVQVAAVAGHEGGGGPVRVGGVHLAAPVVGQPARHREVAKQAGRVQRGVPAGLQALGGVRLALLHEPANDVQLAIPSSQCQRGVAVHHGLVREGSTGVHQPFHDVQVAKRTRSMEHCLSIIYGQVGVRSPVLHQPLQDVGLARDAGLNGWGQSVAADLVGIGSSSLHQTLHCLKVPVVTGCVQRICVRVTRVDQPLHHLVVAVLPCQECRGGKVAPGQVRVPPLSDQPLQRLQVSVLTGQAHGGGPIVRRSVGTRAAVVKDPLHEGDVPPATGSMQQGGAVTLLHQVGVHASILHQPDGHVGMALAAHHRQGGVLHPRSNVCIRPTSSYGKT